MAAWPSVESLDLDFTAPAGRCETYSSPSEIPDAFTGRALAARCPEPAVMTIWSRCRCGHYGRTLTCKPHGPGCANQLCSPCAEDGHHCPLTVERVQ